MRCHGEVIPVVRRGRRRARPVVAAALLAAAGVGACARSEDTSLTAAAQLTGGDPANGKAAIRYYGCGSCHTIPGVDGATAQVGPPLAGLAGRAYIAGVLPNTPDNLIRWIQNPPGVDEKTAMPNVGVTARDARDIAAYLYTLK